MKGLYLFIVVLLLTAHLSLPAQEFGFGFDDEDTANVSNGSGGGLAVSLGGEVEAAMVGFVEDFSDGPGHTRLGDIFSGRLNFSAENSRARGVINVKFAPGPVYYDGQSPVYVDEAYIGAYFGILDIESGLRKLTWGKADSMGPLDVINPFDYTDLSGLRDVVKLKIARPLVHASLRLGQFSSSLLHLWIFCA